MRRLRIYTDTSVIGGCSEAEFDTWSKGLINDFGTGRFRFILSDVTTAGIERAPIPAQQLHAEILPLAETLSITEEALALLEHHEAHGVVETRFRSVVAKLQMSRERNLSALITQEWFGYF